MADYLTDSKLICSIDSSGSYRGGPIAQKAFAEGFAIFVYLARFGAGDNFLGKLGTKITIIECSLANTPQDSTDKRPASQVTWIPKLPNTCARLSAHHRSASDSLNNFRLHKCNIGKN